MHFKRKGPRGPLKEERGREPTRSSVQHAVLSGARVPRHGPRGGVLGKVVCSAGCRLQQFLSIPSANNVQSGGRVGFVRRCFSCKVAGVRGSLRQFRKVPGALFGEKPCKYGDSFHPGLRKRAADYKRYFMEALAKRMLPSRKDSTQHVRHARKISAVLDSNY